MSSAAQLSVRAAPRRFWRWWIGELSEMFPGLHAQPRRRAADVIVTATEQGLLRVEPAAGQMAAARGESEPSGVDAWGALAELARRRPDASVRLRLPYGACFVRRVEIPAAGAGDITKMLELDLERAMPFKLKDIYMGHFLDDARRRPGFVTACQVIAPRAVVDKAIAHVQSAGTKVAQIECCAADGLGALPVDLMPSVQSDAAAPVRSHRLSIALLGIIAALAMFSAYLALSRREAALAQLHEQADAARASVQRARVDAVAADDALKQVRSVIRFAEGRVPVAKIINELTRALPDSAWLTELRLHDGAIDISGFAKPAAELVPALERPPFFGDASLTAPVVRDDGRNRERFSLRLRMMAPSAAVIEEKRASDEEVR